MTETSILSVLFILVAIGLWIASFVCSIIILIDAFKNEVWKGLLALFCGLYLLYYMFAEFQHERKTLIILGGLLASALGTVLFMIAGFATTG
jgi:hypothetical protein